MTLARWLRTAHITAKADPHDARKKRLRHSHLLRLARLHDRELDERSPQERHAELMALIAEMEWGDYAPVLVPPSIRSGLN